MVLLSQQYCRVPSSDVDTLLKRGPGKIPTHLSECHGTKQALWAIIIEVLLVPIVVQWKFFFYRFKAHRGLGFFTPQFIQYYIVICRPSDHTVQRPRGPRFDPGTGDLVPEAETLTTRPPHHSDSSSPNMGRKFRRLFSCWGGIFSHHQMGFKYWILFMTEGLNWI